MSRAPQRPNEPGHNTTIDGSVVAQTEAAIQDILDALDDPDCRVILDATSDQALTASELSETCDLPLSTAYRKVDVLTEAGLLDERVRLSSSGSHTSEYARLVEDVHVSMDEDGLSLTVSRRESQTPDSRGFTPAHSD